MTRSSNIADSGWPILLGIAVLVGLYLISLPSYLLFHTLVELVAIAVATCTFVIAWTGQRLYANSYLLVLGTGFGFVAILEVLHTLVYKGMGALPHPDVVYSTQFWIASRGMLSLTLFLAPLLLGKKVRASLVLLSFAAVTSLLVCSILVWHIFPVTFVEGLGVTPFKTQAEYVICLLLVLGLIALWRQRAQFDPQVLRYLGAAMLLTVVAELFLSHYNNLFGQANVFGHLIMVASFYYFYLAIVRTAFVDPLRLLFRDRERLLETERARAELAEHLNREISHRVKNNLAMVAGLLQLQMAQQQDPQVGAVLSDAASRLMTFANLHEEMQAGQGDTVDLLAVLRRIALAAGEAVFERRVAASVEGDPIHLPAKIAMNWAVVGNELITNAVKHGAPGADGTLRVEVVVRHVNGSLRLEVRNTGRPVPAGFDPHSQMGMGLQLVGGLAEQYQGTLRLLPEPGGNVALVTAPWNSLQ